MKKEPWFGQNIKEVIRVVKSIFKKKEYIEDCPFCHNKLKITDTMQRSIIFETDCEYEYYVECSNCKCKGPKAENYTEALKLWNDRKD